MNLRQLLKKRGYLRRELNEESRGILNELEPHTTSVYFALGKRLWFSKTSGHNFKITLKEDLERFEGLLLLKQKRAAEGNPVDW